MKEKKTQKISGAGSDREDARAADSYVNAVKHLHHYLVIPKQIKKSVRWNSKSEMQDFDVDQMKISTY